MAAAGRGHEVLPHTADAGFRARADALPALFEEAARALGELMAETDPGLEPALWEEISLEADDLTDLAYAWLNELIGLAEIRRSAMTAVEVAHIASPAADRPTWLLAARVGLLPHGTAGVRSGAQVKSATYHGLAVEGDDGHWTMEAYVDI
jgi:SHS2 domain-containing protein